MSVQDFAANQTDRDAIENGMLYSYYALYGVIFVLLFAIIPFVYFYFEEKNDDGFGNYLAMIQSS